MNILKKLFGDYSKKELKRVKPILDSVLELEDKYKGVSDEELINQTNILKERLAKGETTDDILPDAFAVCREASDRVLGMRHYPVQIIGGIILHQGRISEMRTGEGKTLVATLPAYLNALEGKGVHIVTVNDYLARRDSEWMGKLYRFLGLTVGLIVHDMPNPERKKAYDADITYGTNNELGFDYLRDNMVVYKENKVQRGHHFAIVDEVDSILIDEARTPLIISGQGDKSTDMYQKADKIARNLKMHKVAELDSKEDHDEEFKDSDYDYIVDEKAKTATLTQNGMKKVEKYFGIDNLTDPENVTIQHHINQAIKAYGIMNRDIEYVVKDGQIVIVDEFTGRLMFGRRYNEGLHQAIEAKEGVKVERESKTLATITFQNYFRLYKKLSGMTGTAMTEETEFQEIYKLDVIEIPTNKPIQRIDLPDAIFRSEKGKYIALIRDIEEAHKKGQPVLVGTISIEKSELLSAMLKKKGIKHEVLNAKYHEKEAEIVAQAGKYGAVTIATNMAGRGTDIMLGGNAEYMAKAEMRRMGIPEELISEATGFAETSDEEILNARKTFTELNNKYKESIKEEAEKVREAGGLFIMGTERHESRRIDNQLRGRAGRQGDPGTSRFYLSTEDDLMRLFGGDRIQGLLDRLMQEEDMAIESKMLSNTIESAQSKVEARNFGIRKNVLDFDDVMNRQREIIYDQRDKVLNGDDLHDQIMKMLDDTAQDNVNRYITDDEDKDNWNLEGLRNHYLGWVFTGENEFTFTDEEMMDIQKSDLVKIIQDKQRELYKENEEMLPKEIIREMERVYLLKNVDSNWMEHIDAMEELKRGIRLRAYGQHDPVVAYRLEGFDMFDEMIATIKELTVKAMLLSPKKYIEQQKQREEQQRRILQKIKISTQGEVTHNTVISIDNAEQTNNEDISENEQPVLQNKQEMTIESLGIKREQVAKPTSTSADGTDNVNKTVRKTAKQKVGRNDPCPCGSGKKYKKCCGKQSID